MTSKGEEEGSLSYIKADVDCSECAWSNTCVNSTHKPGLDHFSPSCSSCFHPVHPSFPLSNASLGHYIAPIEEGEEMQRSSQTESCVGSSVI